MRISYDYAYRARLKIKETVLVLAGLVVTVTVELFVCITTLHCTVEASGNFFYGPWIQAAVSFLCSNRNMAVLEAKAKQPAASINTVVHTSVT
jgi:hypothetical protein